MERQKKERGVVMTTFKRNMCKSDWELVENVEETQPLLPDQLEPIPLLKKKEDFIGNEKLVKCTVSFGQCQAEYLDEHQGEIPKEWRQYCLIFPGTIWRSLNDRFNILCLYWNGAHWYLSFRDFEHDFNDHVRLLCLRE